MFDRLFDLIADVWESVLPFVVIDIYEKGVVLRWGKPVRAIEPGFQWLWPLIEEVKSDTVVRQTAYLDVQSLTSHDKKLIALAAIVIFKITDISKFLLEIDEGETDVMNMVYGVISDCVEAHDWSYIITSAFNKEVLHKTRLATKEHCGVHVISIKWSDKTTARSIRLWND